MSKSGNVFVESKICAECANPALGQYDVTNTVQQ